MEKSRNTSVQREDALAKVWLKPVQSSGLKDSEEPMSTSQAEITGASALSVRVTDLDLSVDLSDGRTITVPLAWFPRIAMGTQKERENWSLIGGGHGIQWPELDEDISVESLLTGQRSRESDSSLRKWIEGRGIR